jgi:hypothetical protein
MDEELFEGLKASVQEMKAYEKGELKTARVSEFVPVSLSELKENMKKHGPLFFWSPFLLVTMGWDYELEYEGQIGMD